MVWATDEARQEYPEFTIADERANKLLGLLEEANREGSGQEAESLKMQLLNMLEMKDRRPLPPNAPPSGTIGAAPKQTKFSPSPRAPVLSDKERHEQRKDEPLSSRLGLPKMGQPMREFIDKPLVETIGKPYIKGVKAGDESWDDLTHALGGRVGWKTPTELKQEESKTPKQLAEKAKLALAKARGEKIEQPEEEEIPATAEEEIPTPTRIPPPAEGVTSLPLSDGTTQELGRAYPYAGGLVNLQNDAARYNLKIFVNADHGGFREDPTERIFDNPKTYAHMFIDPNGPMTKENLKPDALVRLYKSSHNLDASGGGQPTAIDVFMNLAEEAARLEKTLGKGAGLTPGGLPTNAAFRESDLGKWATEHEGYNLLKNGWILRGDDTEYYNKFGKEEGLPQGIEHPSGRFEHWHWEYDPVEAERRLIKLGYMDAQTKELIPPAGAFTGKPQEGITVTTDKDGKPTNVGKTPSTNKEIYSDAMSKAQSLWNEGKKHEGAVATIGDFALASDKAHNALIKQLSPYERATEEALQAKEVKEQEFAYAAEEEAKARSEIEIRKAADIQLIANESDRLARAGQEREDNELKSVKKTSDWIRKNRTDPYRQFAWINEDGDHTVGQVVYTIAAVIALIANIAVTAKSAMRKKGKVFPLMAWDMITGAINMDIKAQEAALAGAYASQNASESLLGQYRSSTTSKLAAMQQAKADMLDYYDTELERAKAKFGKDGLVESQAIAGELIAKIKGEKAQLALGIKQTVKQEVASQLASKISSTGAVSQHKERALGLILAAAGAEATERARRGKTKLTTKQEQTMHGLFAMMGDLKKAKGIWEKHGSSMLITKWLASKGAFNLVDIGYERGNELAALTELREMLAASLATLAGNVGNLTEIEQLRGMLQIPKTDTGKIGTWKLQRAIQAARLGSLRGYYLLDDIRKTQITKAILSFGDDEKGLSDQSMYMERLITELGGDQFQVEKTTDEELDAGFKTSTNLIKTDKQVVNEMNQASKPVSRDKLPGKPIGE